MTPIHGTLVGRERNLEAIEKHLEVVANGRAAFLAFVGEAGIGKTRLLEELCVRAAERDWLVLEGRGDELQRELPFGVIVETFERYLDRQPAAALQQLGGDQALELSALFPGFQPATPDRLLENDAERYRLHRAVAGLITKLARERPLVIALDDLHWADGPTVELVGQLLRRPPVAPVLLGVGYRSGRATSRVDRTVLTEAREGVVEVMTLEPLTAADAGKLLDPELDPASRDEIYETSGGNPFYLEQLARSLARHPQVPEPATPEGEPAVPLAVSAAIESEVDALLPVDQELIRCAAVVGERFTVDAASEVAELEDDVALSALDELLAAELVRATAIPREFRFRHPIVRQAIYDQTATDWRFAAHRRAAAALESAGAPVTARAAHVERSAHPGDEEAVALLTDAGFQAAPRAPGAAIRWYSAALRLLSADAPPERRLALLLPLATALAANGQLQQSRAALWEALELAPKDFPLVGASLISFVAELDQLLGRSVQARGMLMEALEALDSRESPEAITVQLALAREGWRSNDADSILAWASPAREAAARLPAEQSLLLLTSAESLVAVGEAFRGDMKAAAVAAQAAANLADEQSDDQLAGNLQALPSLGYAELALERFEDAYRHLGRGIAILRRTNQTYVFGPIVTLYAYGQLQQGKLDEAVEPIDGLIEASRLGNNDQFMAWGQFLRCRLARFRGNLREATEAGEQAAAIAARAPHLFFGWLADAELGVILIEGGEPARGRSRILAHSGGPDLPRAEPTRRPWLYEPLAQSALAEGDLAGAEEWVERGEATADLVGIPGPRGLAQHARAALELAQGNHRAAIDNALGGASLLAENGHRLEAARAHVIAGQAFSKMGNREPALAEFEWAYGEFDDCGALRLADEVARELRRLGRRTPGRGRAQAELGGIGVLSVRERQVAELVAEGLTNPQIAARLYLSKKTVETHVSHIFAKLEVHSRAAVGRRMADHRS